MLDILDVSTEKLLILKEFIELFKFNPSVLYENEMHFVREWILEDLKAQLPQKIEDPGYVDLSEEDENIEEQIDGPGFNSACLPQLINVEVTRIKSPKSSDQDKEDNAEELDVMEDCFSNLEKQIELSRKVNTEAEYHLARTVIRTFGCNVCHKKFGSETSLKMHRATHAEDIDSDAPGYMIVEPADKLERTTVVADEENKTCQACGMHFERRRLLKEHALAVHGIKKPFHCWQCDFVTAKYERLRPHMSVHTGEKPYTCSFCPRTFRMKATADHHILTHTKERPYKCLKCEKSFRHPSTLKKHITAVHENLKPHICETCGRAFSHINSFQRHKQNKVCIEKHKL